MALSVVRVRLSYDEVLVRQTEEADNLFFVTSGELKLVADAEQHKQQFADVMKSASNVLLDDKCVRTLHNLFESIVDKLKSHFLLQC